MNKVLIIGYGNSLRDDDAIGVHAAHLLEEMYRDDPAVRVIGAHQLTPEMAEDIAEAKFVVFLDAAVGARPGEIGKTSLQARRGSAGFTHHCTPATLLLAAEQLYGEAPSAIGLTITGASFEVGKRLTPVVKRRLPELIAAVQEVVVSWRRQRLREASLRTR